MNFAEQFLQTPDQFPDAQKAEPWGDIERVIDFTGGPYLFTGLNDHQAQVMQERFGDLCQPPQQASSATVEIKVNRIADGHFRDFNTQGWEYTFDLDYTANSVQLAGLQFMAQLDWSSGLSGILWMTEKEKLISHSALDNFFRVMVAYRLLHRGGVLLHSAALVDDDGAQVFFGRSGAGKSTISHLGLEHGRRVLSDDLNALRPVDGRFVVEKLPFTGDLGRTHTPDGQYPVRGLYRLHQGEMNALGALRPAEAISALIVCAPYVNRDPYRNAQLMDNLSALLDTAPVQDLTFTKDGSVWQLFDTDKAQSHG